MAVNYLRLQREVMRQLSANGSRYLLTRPGGIKIEQGKEITLPDKTFTVNGIKKNYQAAEIDGTVIKGGDVQLVLTSEVEIVVGDRIALDGAVYRVEAVNKEQPAEVALCYRAQLRR